LGTYSADGLDLNSLVFYPDYVCRPNYVVSLVKLGDGKREEPLEPLEIGLFYPLLTGL